MKRKQLPNPMVPIQNAQLLAIEGRLSNTMDAFERRVRRWFSKEHSTAYLDTFKLPWDELLLHYYESNLANKSYNEVFDLAVEQYLPEFMEEAEDIDQEFAASLVKRQEAELKAKKARDQHQKDIEAAAQQMGDKAAIIKDKAQSIGKKLDKKRANKPSPKAMSLKFDDNPDDDV